MFWVQMECWCTENLRLHTTGSRTSDKKVKKNTSYNKYRINTHLYHVKVKPIFANVSIVAHWKVKNPKSRLKNLQKASFNHGIKAEFSAFSKASQYYILRTVWRLEPEDITCSLT